MYNPWCLQKTFPIYNEGGITIGSKTIRRFTPRYSLVNNIVEKLCRSVSFLQIFSDFFLSTDSKRK